MFVIGGVTALKQHAFFEDLDWTDLINLEIEPPIDLSKPYVLLNSNNNNNNNSNGNNINNDNNGNNGYGNPQTPGTSNAKKGDINSAAVTSINKNTNKEKESDKEGRSSPVSPRIPLNAEPSSVQTLPLTMEHLTRHFHEGFTGQQVSLSDVEESYSTSTLSRAGTLLSSVLSYLPFLSSFFSVSLSLFFLMTRIPHPCAPHLYLYRYLSGSETSNEYRYDGFEFVGQQFEYSADQVTLPLLPFTSLSCSSSNSYWYALHLPPIMQMKKFEDDLVIKTAKILKKKKMKMKKDGEKADKAMVTEKAKILKEIEDKEVKRKLDEAEKELFMKKKLESERLESLKNMMTLREKRLSTLKSVQCNIDAYAATLDTTQKKLKGLRKKLRDIEELEVKVKGGLKASKEQKEKIEKRQGVEDDIVELEEAEEELKNNIPLPVPASLLVEDEGWDAVTESFTLPVLSINTASNTTSASVIDMLAATAQPITTPSTIPAATVSKAGKGTVTAAVTPVVGSSGIQVTGSANAVKKKKK